MGCELVAIFSAINDKYMGSTCVPPLHSTDYMLYTLASLYPRGMYIRAQKGLIT